MKHCIDIHICITGAITVLAVPPLQASNTTPLAVPRSPTAGFLEVIGSSPSDQPPNFLQSKSSRPEIVDFPNAQSQIVGFTCLTEPINSSPRSVTVIPRSRIEQQAALTRNLDGILEQLVPGLSPLTPSGRRGLSLRGRRVGVLIDGVPLETGSVGLIGIDPDTIERIEVIPTPSPLCRVRKPRAQPSELLFPGAIARLAATPCEQTAVIDPQHATLPAEWRCHS